MLCYLYPEPQLFIFSSELPDLLYYSHIPAAVIALLIGLFVYFNGRGYLLNRLLAVITLCFAFWVFINLVTWTNIHSELVLFAWSFFGPLFGLISIFAIYFVYVFAKEGRDAPLWAKSVFALMLAPVFLLAPTTASLTGLNITGCDAFGYENLWFEIYYHALGVIAILWILVLLFSAYRRAAPVFKKQILLLGIGVEFFLATFFFVGYLSSYLTTLGVLEDSDLELYGLFGMIVFMVYLAILLVRFKTFHVNVIAPQALTVALVIIIGAQFTFIESPVNMILNGIALALTAVVGVILVRSVAREIEQRKRIEQLARDLTKANDQQVTLIHFITHQIKGFVTKSRNIFAMMKEGEFGVMPDTAKPMIEQGFDSDTKGLATIQEILNAANIKSGKVSFTMAPFDLKALIEGIAKDLSANASAKGLALNTELGTEPFMVMGDSVQLVNAYKNLIDNSIKYTPSGSVTLHLEKKDGKALFTISDTGVGITPEDMKNLFTEGGHGKDSAKINVDSTGFGLYIVKSIVEAHKGRVWAESEGAGKGSRFIVELPA
jgi:signal transduction histidine kinase